MAENITLARPYAKAVFELARDARQYDKWGKALEVLAALACEPAAQALLTDPRATPAVRAEVFIELCAKAGVTLEVQGRNLVNLLAENRRLTLLPEIAADYAVLRAEAENTLDVEVRAAAALDAAEEKRIAEGLKKKLGRDVKLHVVIDTSLIGGAVIQAGDLVIDGSVRSRLARLQEAIAH